jgi:signal peptidase
VITLKWALKISSRIVLLLLFLSVATILIFIFQAKGNIEKVPSIFGYKALTILSNSMQPKFNAGDVILINNKVEPKLNDVITYKHPDGILVTHRVIGTVKKNGEVFFKTKGDNNNVDDKILIPTSNILGIQKIIIPKAGYVAKFVSSPFGFFIFIAVPLLILIIIEIFQRLGIIREKKPDQIRN